MIAPEWQAAKRILAIRLDNLGDVLVTTPAIHAVGQSLSHASITLLASRVGAQVGALNPDIDDVIVSSAPWMDPWRELPLDPDREQRVIAELRARQFDAAVIFSSFRQSPLPAAYLCYLAGIPLRLAASIDGPGSLLTTRHKHPEQMMHEVERGLDLVGAVGMSTTDDRLVLVPPPEAAPSIAHLTAGSQPLVVVHPGCSMPARTYPWEMYAEVVTLLVQELQARVVLTGAEHERPMVNDLVDRLPLEVRPHVEAAAGTLAFPEFCALIQAADLTITNNTGPMHMSAALNTPVIALFALTNPPEQWGPWRVPHRLLYREVPCRLCYNRICPIDHACLAGVPPRDVVATAADLLGAAIPVRAPMQAAR